MVPSSLKNQPLLSSEWMFPRFFLKLDPSLMTSSSITQCGIWEHWEKILGRDSSQMRSFGNLVRSKALCQESEPQNRQELIHSLPPGSGEKDSSKKFSQRTCLPFCFPIPSTLSSLLLVLPLPPIREPANLHWVTLKIKLALLKDLCIRQHAV